MTLLGGCGVQGGEGGGVRGAVQGGVLPAHGPDVLPRRALLRWDHITTAHQVTRRAVTPHLLS